MRGRALAALFLTAALAGCAVPIATKSAIRSPQRLAAPAETACGYYVALAHYWDDNATKVSIDLAGSSHLKLIPEERSEITIGSSPYYALMDLSARTRRLETAFPARNDLGKGAPAPQKRAQTARKGAPEPQRSTLGVLFFRLPAPEIANHVDHTRCDEREGLVATVLVEVCQDRR